MNNVSNGNLKQCVRVHFAYIVIGEKPNMTDSIGNLNESMIWCTKTGELQSLKTLLKENPNKINEHINGRTLLHYAADAGNSDVLKELINNGANINSKDKFGLTPLLAAIYEDHIDCVKYLLEQVSLHLNLKICP